MTLNLDDLHITINVSAVSEPATLAQVVGLMAFAGVVIRRRSPRRSRTA